MSGIFDQIINYSPPLTVSGTVNYDGTWNATTNTPTLINPPAASTKGDYYVVSVAGTQFSISFAVGDWIISNGTAWEKVDLTDAVSSVFNRTGAVVGVSTDYSAVGITNTAIGAANPSTGAFTTVTASSTISASNFSGTSSGTNTGDNATNSQYSGLVSNATHTGDATGATALTLATVNSNVGSFGSATQSPSITINGKGLVTAASATTITPAVGSITGLGTGVATALAVNVGTAGAAVVNGGVLGTPSSGTLTSCTGLPISTGVAGLGTSVATALAVNVGSAGAPVVNGGVLGTPSSGTVTNLTGTASINTNGAHNGTVGATTPSTGAFTTLSSTGSTTISGGLFQGAAGAGAYATFAGNSLAGVTGANVEIGHNGTTGAINSFNRTTSAYKALTIDALNIDLNASGTTRAAISSSGLAVTGTLSASGAITPSQTAGIVGTTTNNDANAGSVGEYISSTVTPASGVSLSSGTQHNITSITLSAGDWDVGGTWQLTFSSGAATGYARASIGTSSATISATSTSAVNSGVALTDPAGVGVNGVGFGTAMPTTRFSVSGSTTVYLVTQCSFSGTLKGAGILWCRRIR